MISPSLPARAVVRSALQSSVVDLASDMNSAGDKSPVKVFVTKTDETRDDMPSIYDPNVFSLASIVSQSVTRYTVGCSISLETTDQPEPQLAIKWRFRTKTNGIDGKKTSNVVLHDDKTMYIQYHVAGSMTSGQDSEERPFKTKDKTFVNFFVPKQGNKVDVQLLLEFRSEQQFRKFSVKLGRSKPKLYEEMMKNACNRQQLKSYLNQFKAKRDGGADDGPPQHLSKPKENRGMRRKRKSAAKDVEVSATILWYPFLYGSLVCTPINKFLENIGLKIGHGRLTLQEKGFDSFSWFSHSRAFKKSFIHGLVVITEKTEKYLAPSEWFNDELVNFFCAW